MKNISLKITNDEPHRQIPDKAFHPSGSFVEFYKDEVEQSIPARFEKIAASYPNRLAVRFGPCSYTYAVLNARANQIAQTLLERSDKRGEPIALLLENDASFIAAILGVLKAGKIFMLVEPSLPPARIGYVLEDMQPSLLITETKNLPLAQSLAKTMVPMLNLDKLETPFFQENVRLSIAPTTLAWIIYSLDSLGQPKGVTQNHQNVLHIVQNCTNAFRLCADDRLISLFPGSINASVHDIFSALLNGASLHLFKSKKAGLVELSERILRDQLTILSSVPPVFRAFIECLEGKEHFPYLRLIKLNGESVSKQDVDKFQKYFSSTCVLINGLGRTETGPICWYFINKETAVDDAIVPVGYPVEGSEIVLLDDGGHGVQAREMGEISVKSRYLSPGYWRRPDLTRVVFPAAAEDTRLYRTGDLGRMLTDNCLLWLGRKDSQVQIGGHCIDTAEIEMALRSLESVRAAVVSVSEAPDGNPRLIAYLIPTGNSVLTTTKLRRALMRSLPEYMIPSIFLMLDKFPLALNGKVNRQALPIPTSTRPELDTPFTAPVTSIEKQLAKIWAEILRLDQVGVRDDFTDLGGHSLAATKVACAVFKAFNLKIPQQSLFQSPTISAMAKVIAKSLKNSPDAHNRKRVLTKLITLSRRDSTNQPTRRGPSYSFEDRQESPEAPGIND